jgi:hypothetical protein
LRFSDVFRITYNTSEQLFRKKISLRTDANDIKKLKEINKE